MAAFGIAKRVGLKITTVTEQKGYHTVETEYFTASPPDRI
jgi:hypothetical protein